MARILSRFLVFSATERTDEATGAARVSKNNNNRAPDKTSKGTTRPMDTRRMWLSGLLLLLAAVTPNMCEYAVKFVYNDKYKPPPPNMAHR